MHLLVYLLFLLGSNILLGMMQEYQFSLYRIFHQDIECMWLVFQQFDKFQMGNLGQLWILLDMFHQQRTYLLHYF
jgi:hypothetical protein